MQRRELLFLTGAAFALVPAALRAQGRVVREVVLGRPDAPATVIEYFSLTCPHCATFHRETLPIIKQKYIETGRLKWVLRDFPLDRYALVAAVLAHCAGPERYPAFVETFLETQAQWARSPDPLAALRTLAKLGGLSDEEMDACLADESMVDGILRMRLEGERTFGVDSTPTFIIAGQRHSGAIPPAEFERLLQPLFARDG